MLAQLLASEGRPVFAARRVPYLPAAVLGNGALLATVSARGELERLFWPHVDAGQHLGELRLAAFSGGELRWLDEEPDGREQTYLDESSVLLTRAGHVELTDVVRPFEPVLARRICARGADRLAVYLRPWLDEAAHGQAIYVDPERDALVVYRRDIALAVSLDRPHEFTCGRSVRGDNSSVLADLADGRLEGWTVAHRDVEGALACPGDEATLVLAFGSTPDDALARLDDALALGCDGLREERQRHDRERIGGALASTADRLEPVYRRSLLVFDLVSDRETGGVIAAPELDARFVESGGYGFVWARDLAFTVLAFLACGRDDLTAAGLRWLLRTQSPEGLWLQRHGTDGALAACWGLHQLDETGAALFAFDAAWHELHDEELDRELWPAACRAAGFLAGFLDPAAGLPLPSVDLWEQSEGQHAYTAAAVFGGLVAAARMAERHDPERADGWLAAAARVREGIETHLWSEEHGRYLRSIAVAERRGPAAPLPATYRHGLRYPNRPVRSVRPVDERLDASLLGLAWPFRAVDPAGPRMRATLDALVVGLGTGRGGLRRHEGDTYAGGNEWVLAGLWHGLVRRQVGDELGLQAALDRALESATPLGLLPEQVREDGSPAWVLPLTWSHAMFVLAARPELAAIAEPPRLPATARA
jgi:glucoamylase